MLPLQAQGYRSGFSASPGFRQILQTSSSSSSSSISASYFAAASPKETDDAIDDVAFSSFSDEVDDVDGDGFMLSAIMASVMEVGFSPPSGGEGGAAGAISIGLSWLSEFAERDRVR